MKTRIAVIMLGVVLIFAGIAGAQIPPALQTQPLLPGAMIPKFGHQLPVAGQITVVNSTQAVLFGIPSTPAYNINIREFQAQILPTGFPASWVWGYLTDADVTAGGVRPSYLGPVVLAARGQTSTPKYINQLPYGINSNVQGLLPIDMTLDWANPNPQTACPTPTDPFDAFYTNTACGVLPSYTGPQPAATHLHGGEVEPLYDGGPDAWATPGNSQTGAGFPTNGVYTYPNGQEEATLWFHDHALGITRLNVYAGLAGLYPLIDGGSTNPPSGAVMPAFPTYDIPLIIQDRSFDTQGQIFYNLASNPQPNPFVHPFWIPEFVGDVIVVNGKTWPNLNVEAGQYRFRLVNGSNARFYDLTLDTQAQARRRQRGGGGNQGLPFIVIATDGGYLQSAVSTPNLVIGPGERYEVIVDFTNLAIGDMVIMKNSARTPFPGGAAPTNNGTDTVMRFTVTSAFQGTPTNIQNNTTLRPVGEPLPIIDGFLAGTNIRRQLTLNEVIGPGGPLELVINNSKFNHFEITTGCNSPVDLCRETELPALGDTEVWEIINITADAHPMHTHLVTFQILDRIPFNAAKWINQYDALLLGTGRLPGDGPPNPYLQLNGDDAIGGNPAIIPFLNQRKRRGPLLHEMGWKDTAIMYPGEMTRIVIRWAAQDVPVVVTPGNLVDIATYPDAGYAFSPTGRQGTGAGVGYVWHCHIIDHEDNEMMRNYVVGTARQVPVAAP